MPSAPPSCSPCGPSTTAARAAWPTPRTRRARCRPTHFADLEAFRLPLGCRLVGVEITDDAIELPSFRHPRQAAYILGSEREGLSAEVQSHLRLRGEDPDPLLGQSRRRRRPDHVRPPAQPGPPRPAPGRRGRADRGRRRCRCSASRSTSASSGSAREPRQRTEMTREDRRGGRAGPHGGPGAGAASDGPRLDLQLRHRPPVGRRHLVVRTLPADLRLVHAVATSSTASCSTACCICCCRARRCWCGWRSRSASRWPGRSPRTRPG